MTRRRHAAPTPPTGIDGTSPVGCFRAGASTCGSLDMAGIVWEWTRSLWGRCREKPDFGYPYASGDGREDLAAGRDTLRVLRGGAFGNGVRSLRCAYRDWYYPDVRHVGFRVVVSPSTSGL